MASGGVRPEGGVVRKEEVAQETELAVEIDPGDFERSRVFG